MICQVIIFIVIRSFIIIKSCLTFTINLFNIIHFFFFIFWAFWFFNLFRTFFLKHHRIMLDLISINLICDVASKIHLIVWITLIILELLNVCLTHLFIRYNLLLILCRWNALLNWIARCFRKPKCLWWSCIKTLRIFNNLGLSHAQMRIHVIMWDIGSWSVNTIRS